MANLEAVGQDLAPKELYFDPEEYLQKIDTARDFIRKRLPPMFIPRVAITLGSGGLGKVADTIENPTIIPYREIPGFKQTSIEGHTGNLVAGYIMGVPTIGFQGRRHYYEEGGQPDQVICLKNITFPVYVARALEAEIYIATNAAGGLNPDYKPGDLMVIKSHIGIFHPNPLAGPPVNFMGAPRFQPQNTEYNPELRKLLKEAAKRIGGKKHVHVGVYVALPGPTYETSAECQMLRQIGADAVGMSTVPEIIVATNIGMDTCGISLITNVIAKDGTNATSHEEVMQTLQNPSTEERISNIINEFYRLMKENIYGSTAVYPS